MEEKTTVKKTKPVKNPNVNKNVEDTEWKNGYYPFECHTLPVSKISSVHLFKNGSDALIIEFSMDNSEKVLCSLKNFVLSTYPYYNNFTDDYNDFISSVKKSISNGEKFNSDNYTLFSTVHKIVTEIIRNSKDNTLPIMYFDKENGK